MSRRRRGSSHAHRVLAALVAVLTACASAPQAPPPDPSRTAAAFAARRLDALPADGAPAAAAWGLEEWFDAALRLNPQLAEGRAHVLAVAAAERTAAEHPNPTMDLFAEYVDTAARSAAWLYGVSLDFLLRRPGDRARARRNAAVQTAVAESDLAEAIWRVRASLRLALLDVASARDEAALLETLVGERQALLASGRAQADAGELARTETLASELELARAAQRLDHARARGRDAEARLAAAVGLPVSALEGVAVRWDRWADIAALVSAAARDWRGEALIGRPEIVRAVREYDLADISLQGELARRWPEAHVNPGYSWGHDGIRQDPLNDVMHENALGVGFELPVFNQHQGAIGEAIARRDTAREHLVAIQADMYEQIDRAQRAWPRARLAWEEAAAAAAIASRLREAEARALTAGVTDRSGSLAAAVAATEAELLVLQAAYEAELAFGALEDAYRRPLQGPDGAPNPVSPAS